MDTKAMLGKMEQLPGELALKAFVEHSVRYANSVIFGGIVDLIVFQMAFFCQD